MSQSSGRPGVLCRDCGAGALRTEIACRCCGAELPQIRSERIFSWLQAFGLCFVFNFAAVVCGLGCLLVDLDFSQWPHRITERSHGFQLASAMLGMAGGFTLFTMTMGALYLGMCGIAGGTALGRARAGLATAMAALSMPLSIISGFAAGMTLVFLYEVTNSFRGGGAFRTETVIFAVGFTAGAITFAGFVAGVAAELSWIKVVRRLGDIPDQPLTECPRCDIALAPNQMDCPQCHFDLRDSLPGPVVLEQGNSNRWIWLAGALPAAGLSYWAIFATCYLVRGFSGEPSSTCFGAGCGVALATIGFALLQFMQSILESLLASVTPVSSRYPSSPPAPATPQSLPVEIPASPIFESDA